MGDKTEFKCSLEAPTVDESLDFANLANLYQGIPLNIIYNVVAFTLITAIFVALRKASWNATQRSSTFKHWLASIFIMDFKTIDERYGRDTMLYLRFQQYCIIFMAIVFVISTAVILPLNFVGKHLNEVSLSGNPCSFKASAKTTQFSGSHVQV